MKDAMGLRIAEAITILIGMRRFYSFLKSEAPGLLGSKAIKWNFTKFLVDRDGQVVKRFAPKDTPESLREDIDSVLSPVGLNGLP